MSLICCRSSSSHSATASFITCSNPSKIVPHDQRLDMMGDGFHFPMWLNLPETTLLSTSSAVCFYVNRKRFEEIAKASMANSYVEVETCFFIPKLFNIQQAPNNQDVDHTTADVRSNCESCGRRN